MHVLECQLPGHRGWVLGAFQGQGVAAPGEGAAEGPQQTSCVQGPSLLAAFGDSIPDRRAVRAVPKPWQQEQAAAQTCGPPGILHTSVVILEVADGGMVACTCEDSTLSLCL